MAGPWLYVISARSHLKFNLNGEQPDVTVENFLALVEDGRIAQDRYWGGKNGIRNHWKDVERGDDLFIYSGDKGAGIIGYAKVVGKEDRPEGRCLVPDFVSVLDKCRALKPGTHRLSADMVKGWGLNHRANVIDLASVENRLRELLPWAGPAHPATSSRSALASRRGRR
jgi:EVE domain